jgi:N-acetylmuramoyl-L-alanine amidase
MKRNPRFNHLTAALLALSFMAPFCGAVVNTMPPVVDISSTSKTIVIIDPAHGGGDYGSTGGGIREKDITLKAARLLKQKLESASADIQVFLTRGSDTAVTPEDRAGFANSRNGAVYISLHCDYVPSASSEGYMVFYYSGDRLSGVSPQGIEWQKVQLLHLVDSTALAALVDQYMKSPLIAAPGSAVQDANDTLPLASRGVRQSALLCLEGVNMPAVAVEMGNLNNTADAGYLKDDGMLGRICYHLEEAIVNFIKGQSARRQ